MILRFEILFGIDERNRPQNKPAREFAHRLLELIDWLEYSQRVKQALIMENIHSLACLVEYVKEKWKCNLSGIRYFDNIKDVEESRIITRIL